MIQNFLRNLKENQKGYISVSCEMGNGFETFADFFENGHDPMFIIDLHSHQFLNVNHQFVQKRCEFEKGLAGFEASLKESDTINSVHFKQDDITILFNPIFQNEGKALIQILRFNQPVNSYNSISNSNGHHLFEESITNKELLNRLPSGIVHTNRDFEALWTNEKFRLLYGREIEQKFNFIDSIYVKNISQFWGLIEKLKEEGGEFKFSFVIHNVKDSSEVFINATAFLVEGQDNMEAGYIFILEDKTENMHFSEEITKQNLALNQINHELDKFLYSVSHNIRGPVASLEGLLKVIEISDVQTVNELKHHLRLNLRLLNGFVSDISNVATNIHTHVNFEEVNLRDLMEQMLMFVDDIFEINPTVKIDIAEDYSIKTDADRLGIIIKGLMKNCFQYQDSSKDKFEIHIKVTQNEDFHLIEIIDNGIGIADKVKPKIFDMFYRGTELSNGNGMGLYNSREILKKLGGTMNIESKEREWTKVKIYLPINI
ncbi:HAMP domain-containing sensor histidine kinase [Marivirga sp.]|uniref:sensor histidine kinase n=1 Tax=Marivirga sp. TaxID=2018662 RepID=UPI0025FFE28A|nr:PAS domain-containing sensor histidine kinase [Marivirga sp.]